MHHHHHRHHQRHTGSHNPFGFRARDVLRTEKVDLRTLALTLIHPTPPAAAAAAAIPSSEGPVVVAAGNAGTRLLARLESLRGIMPVSALDPPVVFVEKAEEPYMGGEEGGGVGRLVVNRHGHFELSSSPPRR
jgi:hypothetical protein